MLRVIFTADDLARVRVAPGPDFLWEITNSVQTLQRRDGVAVFGEWRRWALPRLSERSRWLSPLLPPRGYSPDFLTPTRGDCDTVHEAVDTLLHTPHPRLQTDLTRMASSRRLPTWAGALADGDQDVLGRLAAAVHAYHLEAVAPFWRRIRADIDADRMMRLHRLLDGGTDGLLASLGPQIRWRPPVLETDYPVEQTLHLNGRGITLQPSFFCWPRPFTLADADLPPVLVYPIQHAPDWARPIRGDRADPDTGALGALLGHTRAAVLQAVRSGRSTVELARMLGVTHPAISQHVSVLRAAGLVSTVRTAGRSLHVATSEGLTLLSCAADRGEEEPASR